MIKKLSDTHKVKICVHDKTWEYRVKCNIV